MFGYPCYILPQCGIYFPTILFVQATPTLIMKQYEKFSIQYNLKQNFTIFSSMAHGFFNILTVEMVNDLNDIHHKKPKLALQTSKAVDNFCDNLDNFSDNPTNSFNNPTGITFPPFSIQNDQINFA